MPKPPKRRKLYEIVIPNVQVYELEGTDELSRKVVLVEQQILIEVESYSAKAAIERVGRLIVEG